MIESLTRGFLRLLILTFCGISLPITIFPQDTSCGIIWYPAIQLSDSTHGGFQPRIALSGEDTVHVTWWEDVPPGTRLPYARSVMKNVFEPVRDLITDTITFQYHAHTPFILADYNMLRVVFAYTGTTWPYDTPLRMISSSDFGGTWSSVQSISPQIAGSIG
ncbi:MAG: hypothetical protein QME52_10955, partial [Bacteroidota bacterium]|nr:hypothetical protein [Bacteroidota bacterium]